MKTSAKPGESPGHEASVCLVSQHSLETRTSISSVASAGRFTALCLAAAFWAFSFGAGAPLASLWLQDAGFSDTTIGLNTSIYYLGIALTAPFVPWIMRRWGRRCIVLGMMASGVTVGLFPFGACLAGWFILRALNGMAGAMSLIPLETLVNQTSPPTERGRNFGFYAFSVALGMALGTLVGMQGYPLSPVLAFGVGGGVSLILGTVALYWLPWPEQIHEEQHSKTPLDFGRNFFSFGSAWTQGFLEGGMVSLLPVYLLAIGLSQADVGCLLSGLMIGVILFQVPIAWLADRLGRSNVLLGCTLVVAAGLVWLPFCRGLTDLAIGLFSVGACSGAFYPLGLAILGERLPNSGLPRASAWYLAINCLGSLTGPVAAGVAMDHVGKRALFAVGEAAVLLVLGTSAALRLYAVSHSQRSSATITPGTAGENQTAA